MEKLTEYPRMHYPFEQREWVKLAEEELPLAIHHAIVAQREAAGCHEYLESLPMYLRSDTVFSMREGVAKEARMMLFRVLYLQGMYNANLPIEE